MIGARENNLGSTRSEKRAMRSPNNQEMERPDMTMDNWIQETCYSYMSAVTSGPEEPTPLMMHGTLILQMKEQNGEKLLPKRTLLYRRQKRLERDKNNRCPKRQKTNRMQMGIQNQERWYIQSKTCCTGIQSSATCRFH